MHTLTQITHLHTSLSTTSAEKRNVLLACRENPRAGYPCRPREKERARLGDLEPRKAIVRYQGTGPPRRSSSKRSGARWSRLKNPSQLLWVHWRLLV